MSIETEVAEVLLKWGLDPRGNVVSTPLYWGSETDYETIVGFYGDSIAPLARYSAYEHITLATMEVFTENFGDLPVAEVFEVVVEKMADISAADHPLGKIVWSEESWMLEPLATKALEEASFKVSASSPWYDGTYQVYYTLQ